MSESESEWVSEWDTHVFIRKRTVVIGIFTNFKWQNSGEVKDVTIRGGGQFFRGRLGSWRTLWKLYFSKFKVFMTVSHKSKPVKLLCVRLESDFILFSFRQIKKYQIDQRHYILMWLLLNLLGCVRFAWMLLNRRRFCSCR